MFLGFLLATTEYFTLIFLHFNGLITSLRGALPFLPYKDTTWQCGGIRNIAERVTWCINVCVYVILSCLKLLL